MNAAEQYFQKYGVEHPNIANAKRRRKLEKSFGTAGTAALRKILMRISDTLTHVATSIEKWLASNRYGTEWR